MLSFVFSAAAPLTVVAGVMTIGYAATGVQAFPLVFLLVGAALLLFVPGYLAMARRLPNAGAFYAYIAAGMGRVPAVGVAWISLASYFFVQMAAYGAIGSAVSPLLDAWWGWSPPWWAVAWACWAVVGVLGVRRIEISGRVLALLGAAEVAVVLIFDAANLLPASHPGRPVELAANFHPAGLASAGVGAALVMAVLAFSGVEQAAVFVEEARARTVARATYLAVVAIAVIYAFSAWTMTIPLGPAATITAAGRLGPDLVFGNAAGQLGTGWATAGQVLFATSLLAAMVAFHNTGARYAFALGRERVLPAWLGKTSRRSGSPKYGSLTQTVIAFFVIAAYAVAGLDPLTSLFYLAGAAGGFGILVLLAATSVAVVIYFARAEPAGRPSVWMRLIAPGLAAVALTVMVALALRNFASVLGVPETSPLRWLIPASLAGLAASGCAWALILRTTRPAVFRAIGRGVHSNTPFTPATDRF
ncbi:amino acid permease [Longispora fulva]|nr:amino acid permease [Longispora fulva]